MATGPSTAYTNFRAALRKAESLMRLERTYRDPPQDTEQAIVEGLRGGAVVLMVAAFEAFLRDVFEERVDGLHASRPNLAFSSLPDRMKTSAVYNLLGGAMEGRPGQPPKKRIERVSDIKSAAQHVASDRLIGAAFAVTGGNANTETVVKLFRQVDRSGVLDAIRPRFEKNWGVPVARMFVRARLERIVDARNEIAHGASALPWSRSDLRDAERFLRILAKTLDDDLRIHLNGIGRRTTL